jgi:hypothetical protein
MSTTDTGLWNTRFSRSDGDLFEAGYQLNIHLEKERKPTARYLVVLRTALLAKLLITVGVNCLQSLTIPV